jgi:hypothetical protein
MYLQNDNYFIVTVSEFSRKGKTSSGQTKRRGTKEIK